MAQPLREEKRLVPLRLSKLRETFPIGDEKRCAQGAIALEAAIEAVGSA
ncbi:hypothetical protein G7B40_034050 [Aetokthonos hydrillicola Thurmond2011]|uniref:Uncharacterized protein n=1 Tax=Aetokthonos hydrillicola Thurmond2011 TaxID=2712845 RepID=A0AAP5IDB0_9CYAN|nr:hypothetical protein [Aetokthonos hydrillicola]MBO3459776.1 hypothetical protein [Aetokthonos hydrillicola CCALA 1050]MBW4585209.1 hypothetical protein [Aetokthonos hydrillicola CCALA 1050]MDR9899545.1 hypothetical protein [Aetokthonos hydrillicola Thurmond2011]